MSEDVRARIDKSKSFMYDKLNDDVSSIFYKRGSTTIFITAACVGYYYNEKIPLPPGSARDLFVTSTLGSDTSEKLWILKAIAISEEGINSLNDFKKAIKICQEYANFGIDKLYKFHIDSDDEVIEYTRILTDILEEVT